MDFAYSFFYILEERDSVSYGEVCNYNCWMIAVAFSNNCLFLGCLGWGVLFYKIAFCHPSK